MELFERQWATYQALVEHDLMEHRGLTKAIDNTIQAWLGNREPIAPEPQFVDLGCGDLGVMAPLLRRLPLGSFVGLDLCSQVLRKAKATLGPVNYPCHWQERHLLQWADAEPAHGPVHLLHSSFALHHLSDSEKLCFLQRCRRHLAPQGIFLWADVFREPKETREAYLQRYVHRIHNWQPLAPDQKRQVIDHITSHDNPADREAIQHAAENAGWQWRWVWQGNQRAEALAVLSLA